MKNLVTVISAGLLVAASLAVSAGDTTPYSGYGYGYVPPYGYAPYGYAPYGYGVPVQPPVQLNAEQIKAMQEQQAKAFEYMQNVQRQMAQYYANNPDPIVSMERSLFEQHNAHMQEMGKLIQETNQDKARKEAHGALGHVEHLGCLEDQHKAQAHQGIHDTRHQPVDQYLDKESHTAAPCGSV